MDGPPPPSEQPVDPEDLDAPVLPALAPEALFEQLVGRAHEMAVAQHRLSALLRATHRIIGELDLDVVLRRVVQVACELVDAPYGALGVLSPDGHGLQQFVHAGISDATVRAIGHLPEGKGLLGALIDDPLPIRLRDISTDPRSVGFPEGHPAMRGFLGVPIRLRHEVFGNLYLACEEDREFTAADQDVVSALAVTAGLVITSARLYQESNERQQWLEASTEVTREVLVADSDALKLIAERVRSLARADLVAIGLPDEQAGQVQIAVAVGVEEARLTGLRYEAAGSLSAQVLVSQQPIVVPDAVRLNEGGEQTVQIATVTPVGPVALIPLAAAGSVRGILQVARGVGKAPFTSAEIDMLTGFAVHADLALELADARRDAERMTVLEERGRIARDLHDHVIQQLFAAGMMVDGVRADLPAGGAASERLDEVVTTIDDAIRQIRTAIFQLKPVASSQSLRAAVLDAVTGAARGLGFDPQVDFIGPVDSVSDVELTQDVTAVVRESLTNIAKHAHASAASVRISAKAGLLVVTVTDDGIGLPPDPRCSGLDNLRRRAEERAGDFVATTGPDGGTVVTWTAQSRPHSAPSR